MIGNPAERERLRLRIRELRLLRKLAAEAGRRPWICAAIDFYRERARCRLAGDGWAAGMALDSGGTQGHCADGKPKNKFSPIGGSECSAFDAPRRTSSRESCWEPTGRASDAKWRAGIAKVVADGEHEYREVVASLYRPAPQRQRTPEQIERIVDSIMGG